MRGLTLRNRFVMPAMQRGFMDDGAPTQQMVDYLRRCAAGGVGLVICESTSPDHPSAYWQPVMGRMDAGTLHAWQKVIDAVHAEGAAIFIQLWHPGAMRKVAPDHPLAQLPAWSPSGLIQDGRGNGSAMTHADLAELQASYVRAARDAARLGADGVELHAAHGYLMDQFLWAETNQRTDELWRADAGPARPLSGSGGRGHARCHGSGAGRCRFASRSSRKWITARPSPGIRKTCAA